MKTNTSKPSKLVDKASQQAGAADECHLAAPGKAVCKVQLFLSPYAPWCWNIFSYKSGPFFGVSMSVNIPWSIWVSRGMVWEQNGHSCQWMQWPQARHLDLIRELSAKNREKEALWKGGPPMDMANPMEAYKILWDSMESYGCAHF